MKGKDRKGKDRNRNGNGKGKDMDGLHEAADNKRDDAGRRQRQRMPQPTGPSRRYGERASERAGQTRTVADGRKIFCQVFPPSLPPQRTNNDLGLPPSRR